MVKASDPRWSVGTSWRYPHYCKLGRTNSIWNLSPSYCSTVSLLKKTHMISDLMLRIPLIIILSPSKIMTSLSDAGNSKFIAVTSQPCSPDHIGNLPLFKKKQFTVLYCWNKGICYSLILWVNLFFLYRNPVHLLLS